MKTAILICRILLGLLYFVFGLNQFFHFIPMTPPTGDAGVFFTGMVASVYLIPLMGFFQTACGLCLLINKYVPLALLVIMPITLNILMFHIFLVPAGLGMAVAITGISVFLMYAYRVYYQHLKNANATI